MKQNFGVDAFQCASIAGAARLAGYDRSELFEQGYCRRLAAYGLPLCVGAKRGVDLPGVKDTARGDISSSREQ